MDIISARQLIDDYLKTDRGPDSTGHISSLSKSEVILIMERYAKQFLQIAKGYPTSCKDVSGDIIKVGDLIGYTNDESRFEVVFRENAFRKRFADWNETLPYPILEESPLYWIVKHYNQ